MASSKSIFQKYRFKIIDGVPYFETRYFAEKYYYDVFLSYFGDEGHNILENYNGFYIEIHCKLLVDNFGNPEV